MSGFDFYAQAWALYIALGIVFLWLVDLKLKKRSFKLRLGLLLMLAVGAFTPQGVTDADSVAPMILTSLLQAEVDGLGPIYKMLVTMSLIWGVAFFAILAVRNLINSRQDTTPSNGSATQKSAQSAPINPAEASKTE